jgi:hypothetical protein
MVESVSAAPRKGRQAGKFNVGDLVTTNTGQLVYMLVPCDNVHPARTGRGTLTGVLVHRTGHRDLAGDELPCLGYLHNNLGEDRLKLYARAVHLQN